MTHFSLQIWIRASPETCFDAARDIGLHCRTAHFTQERAVEGVTSGLIGLCETVTFEGVHLGVRQRLTSRIVQFERPRSFTDQMERGIFVQMSHLHRFEPCDGGTIMTDEVRWISPLGVLGRLADKWFVEPHLRGFVLQRNLALKRWIELGY